MVKHFRGVQPMTQLIIFSASNAELFVVGVPTQAQVKSARFAMR